MYNTYIQKIDILDENIYVKCDVRYSSLITNRHLQVVDCRNSDKYISYVYFKNNFSL